MKIKRIFLTVLDSVGAGEAPDADKFGDVGSHTLQSLTLSDKLYIPNLKKAGIGNIEGLEFFGRTDTPTASYGRMHEVSSGKDTTTGHFEISGIISKKPFPTYPNGFPDEIVDKFSKVCGRNIICNKPYSGTQVIADFGDEHVKSGSLIVYTSADSVFQIAAHEDVVPLDTLYEYCREARKILTGENAVGRVIARPFKGESGKYYRTANRRDFSLEPPGETILDAMKSSGYDVISIGKISDIFAARGITLSIPSHSNDEGMEKMSEVQKSDFCGMCFTNLVDFDMLYGHRRDTDGYAKALSEFDSFLSHFTENMKDDDILILTADHGCDPAFTKTTDHTREYVPLLVFGKSIRKVDLGTRKTFADIAKTIAGLFGINYDFPGESFANDLTI